MRLAPHHFLFHGRIYFSFRKSYTLACAAACAETVAEVAGTCSCHDGATLLVTLGTSALPCARCKHTFTFKPSSLPCQCIYAAQKPCHCARLAIRLLRDGVHVKDTLASVIAARPDTAIAAAVAAGLQALQDDFETGRNRRLEARARNAAILSIGF